MTKVVRVKKKKRQPHEDKRVGKRPTPKQKAKREERERKQMQALELRQAGTTYQQIANALGLYDASTAKRYVDKAMSNLVIEAAKDVVRMDLARLDEFQMRATHSLRQNGDLGQIDRLMRIMEMRYRLLGVSDETIRSMQSEHGITNVTNKNNIMVVQASPETEDEFIKKMMRAVGVNPDSEEGKVLLEQQTGHPIAPLPMAPGSANQMAEDAINQASTKINEGEIVEGIVVHDDDE